MPLGKARVIFGQAKCKACDKALQLGDSRLGR